MLHSLARFDAARGMMSMFMSNFLEASAAGAQGDEAGVTAALSVPLGAPGTDGGLAATGAVSEDDRHIIVRFGYLRHSRRGLDAQALYFPKWCAPRLFLLPRCVDVGRCCRTLPRLPQASLQRDEQLRVRRAGWTSTGAARGGPSISTCFASATPFSSTSARRRPASSTHVRAPSRAACPCALSGSRRHAHHAHVSACALHAGMPFMTLS